jgi:hypothetical protein
LNIRRTSFYISNCEDLKTLKEFTKHKQEILCGTCNPTWFSIWLLNFIEKDGTYRWRLTNQIKIIFSSCSRFLICRCVRDLTKRRRHPRVSDLGSMSELTNQIAAFRILKVITIIWLVNSLIDPRMSMAFRQISHAATYQKTGARWEYDFNQIDVSLTWITRSWSVRLVSRSTR